MRIISPKVLKQFYSEHRDAEGPLRVWMRTVQKTEWKSFHEIKQQYPHASIIGNNRVVFNITGNKYRLVAKVDFEWPVMFIRFIGTYEQYDKINAKEI